MQYTNPKGHPAATSEDSLATSYKTKRTFTVQSSHHAPWYLPNELKTMSTQKLAHRCL